MLTSWKEIAQYVGKGVRTLQHWERQMGLPVRRPKGRVKGMVVALTSELDEWLRTRLPLKESACDELVQLRQKLEVLATENAKLRSELPQRYLQVLQSNLSV
jgi:hypothetical protein